MAARSANEQEWKAVDKVAMDTLVLHSLKVDKAFVFWAESTLAGESKKLTVRAKVFQDYWTNIISLRKKANDLRVESIGKYLFEVVFRESIRDVYYTSLAIAQERKVPIRVVVNIDSAQILNKLPWELLHDSKGFLALRSSTPLVRSLNTTGRATSLDVDLPIRVLFTSNQSKSLGDLDLASEKRILEHQFLRFGDLVELECIHQPSLDDFRQLWIERHDGGQPFQIWHHAGHGGLVSGEAKIFFSDGDRDQGVGSAQLKNIIDANKELRLVIVNTCYSSSAFSSIGVGMAHLNVPAIVGFSGEYGDTSALPFVEALYSSVFSNNMPLEVAVSRARLAIMTSERRFDWFQLVVTTRTLKSSLFSDQTFKQLVSREGEQREEVSEEPGKLLSFER